MDRFILKPFASSATNSGVFGSFMAGSPTTSNDPDTIQSLPAWDEGWASAVTLQGKFPKLEEMQGLQYVISKAVKELYKEGVPVWDADEDYYQYSIVSYTPTGDTAPKLYYNLTGTYSSTNPADDTTNWAELTTSGGQGMPIGTIYALSCSAGYTPEGSLSVDGTQYTKAQFTDLWNNYLTGNDPLLLTCSYADYASDIATYGQCVKWAVDTVNETFKVPTIKDGSFIQQALSDSELGKCYKAGVPNITGTINDVQAGVAGNAITTSGAFSSTKVANNGNSTSGGAGSWDISFSASDSSSIYGNSNTVQPEAVALRYFVVVADCSINQSMMDWAAWASSLAGKLNTDGSNLGTGTGQGTVRAVVETYVNGTSWYRIYSDKWCEQGGQTTISDSTNAHQVSILKEMRDTNYSVFTNFTPASPITGTSGTQEQNVLRYVGDVYDKTVSSFKMQASSNNTGKFDWVVLGYIS